MTNALLTLYFLSHAVTLASPDFQAREAATRSLQHAYPLSRSTVWILRAAKDPEVAQRARAIWSAWKNHRVQTLCAQGFSQCYWQTKLYEPACSLNLMCKFLPGNRHLQVSKEP